MEGCPLMSKPLNEQNGFALSAAGLAEVEALIRRYPTKASALMPCIWVIMDELGHVPEGGVAFLTEKLEVTPARVYEACGRLPPREPPEPAARHARGASSFGPAASNRAR